MLELMVVGLMNWKEGAALFGYCTGKITTIFTRRLPQCTETVQLRFIASICTTKIIVTLVLIQQQKQRLKS